MQDLVVDQAGNSYVTGFAARTQGSRCNIQVIDPLPGAPECGLSFIGKLAGNGSLIFSSYHAMGWSNYLMAGPPGHVYVIGQTLALHVLFAEIDSR